MAFVCVEPECAGTAIALIHTDECEASSVMKSLQNPNEMTRVFSAAFEAECH